jgi:1-acyl-sn-glycerol-3-phosphate acyltransferase
MLFLRSVLFAVAFYTFTAVSSVASSVVSILRPKSLHGFSRGWSHCWLFLYRVICGVRYEVRGREHLPAGGCILAMKHQSVWDTCALFAIFDEPVYVLKSELMLIPFFGWTLARLGCVPVKRGTGRSALESMIRGTRAALDAGHTVVIFPEGTRTAVGAPAAYKSGISHLCAELGVGCVPVALNSGLLWPRRRFLKPPGVITVEILPPIPAGLDRKALMDLLVERIESASLRLLEPSRQDA